MKIKIGFISDTHTFHSKWEMLMIEQGKWNALEHCDVICFCGDMSSRGYTNEIKDFLAWFNDIVPTAKKILISGNHDFFWEKATDEEVKEIMAPYPDMVYLNDSGYEWMGLKFWGSPVQPWFHDWAFNRFRSQGRDNITNGIKQHWNLIPNDTDILIVHGPPRGKLDLLHNKFRRYGENPHVGDDDLLDAVENRIKPKVVAFGHIHEGYGIWSPQSAEVIISDLQEKIKKAESAFSDAVDRLQILSKPTDEWTKANKVKGAAKATLRDLYFEEEKLKEYVASDITYINASVLDEDYKPTNGPIIIEVEV